MTPWLCAWFLAVLIVVIPKPAMDFCYTNFPPLFVQIPFVVQILFHCPNSFLVQMFTFLSRNHFKAKQSGTYIFLIRYVRLRSADLVRGVGGVELQVHVPHQLPHRLQVAAVLTALPAVPGRLSQVLACHACTTPPPPHAKAQVLGTPVCFQACRLIDANRFRLQVSSLSV